MKTTEVRVQDVAAHIRETLGMDVEVQGENCPVSAISVDSRAAGPGGVFVAVQGENAHGAQFAAGAIDLGVSAIVTDPAGVEIVSEMSADAGRLPTLLICEDPRAAAAPAADLIYGFPSHAMPVVGVTGTNGKTSVTTMVARTLQALGRPVGLMGTNGTFLVEADGTEDKVPTVRTTPEAPDLHGLLARMRDRGMEAAALEVSSHAMVLHRADSVRFEVAAFTNLSQDHLDFHADMEEYFQAKASLFKPEHAHRGIVCVDDEWGQRLAAQASIPVITYATREGRGADYQVVDSASLGFRTAFTVDGPDGERLELNSALPGRHYVANSLAVYLIVSSLDLGLSDASIREAVGRAGTVPGRMERVDGRESDPRVVVDYSHTPDALEQTLLTLRGLPDIGAIVTVMGAGGKRDTTKRPIMGAVAARLSDRVIVTDDNPRGDDPAEIRRQVIAGTTGEGARAEVLEQADRARAIRLAISEAKPEDLILIAGKGAETGQDLGTHVIDFDDRELARDALASRPGAQSEGTPHA